MTPTLTGRALRYLARREHSRAELVRKLAPHAPSQEELERVLDTLQAKGFISEERVAQSVLNQRSAKLGNARIAHELKTKGLDAQTIAQAMAALKNTERERARQVWAKKFGQAPQTPVERAKQIRFLASRGFGGEAIAHVVTGSGDD